MVLCEQLNRPGDAAPASLCERVPVKEEERDYFKSLTKLSTIKRWILFYLILYLIYLKKGNVL